MMKGFNWLKGKGTEARDALAAEVSKFRNKEFMQAVVAGCALMALADGNVSSEEKQKMIGFLRNSPELKNFAIADVIAFFQTVLGHFEFDAQFGHAEAMKIIGRVRGNEEQARMVVRVVCVIGGSDGNFDAKEKAVGAMIARELALTPSDFDL